MIKELISTIPGTHGEKYNPAEAVNGFVSWNKFLIKSDTSVPLNKLWKAWILMLTEHNMQDEYSMFIELFECIQIRSMSKAIAETVGSIMNLNNSTGRQLQPVNFSTEICLRFNLAPMHELDGLVEVVRKQYGKSYFRKNLPRGLNVNVLSSSIASYRQREKERAHLPGYIFN